MHGVHRMVSGAPCVCLDGVDLAAGTQSNILSIPFYRALYGAARTIKRADSVPRDQARLGTAQECAERDEPHMPNVSSTRRLVSRQKITLRNASTPSVSSWNAPPTTLDQRWC